jgi:hypothetical protein
MSGPPTTPDGRTMSPAFGKTEPCGCGGTRRSYVALTLAVTDPTWWWFCDRCRKPTPFTAS